MSYTFSINQAIEFLNIEDEIKAVQKALGALESIEQTAKHFVDSHGGNSQNIQKAFNEEYNKVMERCAYKELSISDTPKAIMQGVVNALRENETLKSFGVTVSDVKEFKLPHTKYSESKTSFGFRAEMNLAGFRSFVDVVAEDEEYAGETLFGSLFEPIKEKISDIVTDYTNNLMAYRETREWADNMISDATPEELTRMIINEVPLESYTNSLDDFVKERSKAEQKHKTALCMGRS